MSKKPLLLILLVALGLRIALVLIHPFNFPDSHDYDALARTIVEGRTYQVDGHYATRMPGYPIFIAGVYSLFGPSRMAVLIIQAVLSTLTIYVTYKIALQIRAAQVRLPLVAALLLAFDPLSIAFSASLLTETPFTFLLTLICYLMMRLLTPDPRPSGFMRGHLFLWLVIAMLWVVAVQLRPAAYWCIVPLALLLILFAQNWRERVLHVAGLGVVLLLVQVSLMPWHQRNEKLFDTLNKHENATRFRFTTLEGISLYEAVYPEATGGPRQDLIPLPAEMELLNEAQRNDEWSRRARQHIRAEPGRILKLAFVKIARTWSPLLNAAEFRNNFLLQCALALWHIPLFLLAILTLARPKLLPFRPKLILITPILYFTLLHALFLGSVRYRVPLAPIICLLAACSLLSCFKSRQTPQPTPSSAV